LNRIYVTNYRANSVSVIDGTSNVVLANITGVGPGPDGVAFNPSLNRIYVANNGANSVSVIDGTSNMVLTNITGVGPGPDGVAFNPTTNLVYVTNNGVSGIGNSVSVINATLNTVLIPTITVGTGPSGVGVNPSTNLVYVDNFVDSTVSVISGVNNTVLKTITAPSLSGPIGVGINPITNRVYVTSQLSNSVTVIDGTSNAFLAATNVGPNPVGVGVNPSTNRIFAAIQGNGFVPSSVFVINGVDNTVVTTVTIGASGAGLSAWLHLNVGVNPNTGNAYVANSRENTVSVIGQREEIRSACIIRLISQVNNPPCLVVSSVGTLFPGTSQAGAVNLVAVSLHSNTTKTGTQMVLTVLCDNNTIDPTKQCSAFYVEGNVWGPGQTDLSKSPFIIQNAEPYFYLQFHWWDFANTKIVAWGTWWYGTASNPNWYWGVYWWWRTYVNYYIGIWIPWWWWSWHWMYWRYWGWWGTAFQT
jgi:YVTN family beta-propeller protein